MVMSIYDVMSMDGIVSKRQLKAEQKCNKEYIMKVLNEGENIYPLICDELKKDDDIAGIAVQLRYSKNYDLYRKTVYEPKVHVLIKAAEKFPYNFLNQDEMNKIFNTGYYRTSVWHSEFDIIQEESKKILKAQNTEEDDLLSLDKVYINEISNYGHKLLFEIINEYFKEHINYYEICLALVKNTGELIKFLDFKYSNDKSLAKIAVSQDGLAYKYLSEELKNDYEITLKALINDFRVYDYLPNKFKKDTKLFKEALISSGMDLLKNSYFKNVNKINNNYLNREEIKDFLLISIANTEKKTDIIFIDQVLAEKCKKEELTIEDGEYCKIFDFCGFDKEFFKNNQNNIFKNPREVKTTLKNRIDFPEWIDYGRNSSETVNFKSLFHLTNMDNKDIDYDWGDSFKISLKDEILLKVKEFDIPKKFTHLILREELVKGVYHIGLPLEYELKKVNVLEINEDHIKINDLNIDYEENLLDVSSRETMIEDYYIVELETFEFTAVQSVDY